MDVSCPRCETLYELDDHQVGTGTATLKCSHCGHLFRLKLDAGVQSESQRRWMVRQCETGEFLYFTGFDTLHEWIMEGRVGSEDAISRTGNSWKKLGDIGEFAPIFQVVESIADISESSDRHPQVSRRRSNRRDSSSLDPVANRRDGEVRTPGGMGRPEKSGHISSGDSTSPQENSDSRESRHGGGESRTEASALSRDARFAPQQEDESPSESESDEWTLGQLERPDEVDEVGEVTFVDPRRRRWRGVLVVVVVAAAAVGIWQREEVERIGQQLIQEVAGAVDDEEAVRGATKSGSKEAEMPDISDTATVSVNEALDEATAVIVDQVVDSAATGVGDAVGAGRAGVDAAAATVDEAPVAEPEPSSADVIASARRALERGDTQLAHQRFESVLETSPDHPEAMVGVGWALLADDEPREALEHFERVRERDAGLGDALIGMGRANRSLGRYDQALSAYERYLAEFPDGNQRSIAEFQSERLRDRVGE